MQKVHVFGDVNTIKSDILSIKQDGHPGSVLGPLLCLVYINDIRNLVTDASVKLFADDRNLFVHAKDFSNVIEKSGKCVNDLSVWFFANKLHRVPKKHVTTFSTITLTISVRLQ